MRGRRRFTGVDPTISTLATAFSTLTILNPSSSSEFPNQSLENGPLSASQQQKSKAVAIKRKISHKQRNFNLQFGWNPKTGEPWFTTKRLIHIGSI
jgi:hypothetical protein